MVWGKSREKKSESSKLAYGVGSGHELPVVVNMKASGNAADNNIANETTAKSKNKFLQEVEP